MKFNDTTKGIIIGVLACVLLEFCMWEILGNFYNRGFISLNDIKGTALFFTPLCIIFIIAVLLGVSIARRIYLLRKVTIISTIAIAIVVVSLFIYVIWWIFSQPPPEIIYM
jgi:hypothetical protein